MYKIIQKFVTKNRTYKILKPVGVALHETANAGSTALNHYTYFNGGDRNSLAHIFVDWNYVNDIIQLAPLNECTWHAKEPANSMFISVEMCRPKTHNVEQFNKVWNKCVWLFADIFINTLKITKITKDNLMSHDEIRLKWKNTNHTDPTQLLKEYGKTMDNFRNAVQNEINKQLNIQEVTKLNYKEILTKVASNPTEWETAITVAVNAAKADGNLGALEIFKYLPELIEKIYNSR